MKRSCSILFFLLVPVFLFSQSGTIKIAKPAPPVQPKTQRMFFASVCSNYTFKQIRDIGYEAEILFPGRVQFFHIGLRYSHETENYQLSGYNEETLKAETAYSRSVNRSDYIKMPLGYLININVGARNNFLFSLEAVPEFLIQTKNQYGRLSTSDFNRFNLAASAGIGIPVWKHYSVNLKYSKDLFQNLKDTRIYDGSGIAIGKQRSRTDLLSFSLNYYFSR